MKYAFGIPSLFIAGMVFVFLNPEKAQIWASWFWKIVLFFWKGAEKRYISSDIEGHINIFSKRLASLIPNFKPTGVQIQWIETGEDPEQFFKDQKIIIRVREHRSQDRNFVNAAMAFVSQSVLPRAKRLISKTQRESIDLFVGLKLFESEKPNVVNQFIDEFLSKKTDSNKKVSELIDKYHIIDKGGCFFPVFVQELCFLGTKVFTGIRKDLLTQEVRELINFLENYSNRETGEENVKQEFEGVYCRCGIVIVGKSLKLKIGKAQPYVNHIKTLISKKIETIYLIGSDEKDSRTFIETVGKEVQEKFGYIKANERHYQRKIKKRGKRHEVSTFLLLYRSPKVTTFFDSEDHAEIKIKN